MGFYLYYRKEEKYENKNKLPEEKSTILPFFGFKYENNTNTSYYKKSDGDITLTYSGNGKYKVEQGRPSYRSEKYAVVTFSRSKAPSGKEKEVEEGIYEFLSKKYTSTYDFSGDRYFDPFKTPYLATSVSDYYYHHKLYDKTPGIVTFLLFMPLLACIVCFVIGIVNSLVPLLLWSLGIGVVCFIICGLLLDMIDNKYKREHSYYSLSREEQEAVRGKYIESLTVGNEETDRLLRKYAELKGYTRII